MGEIAKAVGQAAGAPSQAMADAGLMPNPNIGSNYDPGVNLQPAASLLPPLPGIEGPAVGMSEAMPQDLMVDTSMMEPTGAPMSPWMEPPVEEEPEPYTNPYAGGLDKQPEEVLVQGDSWRPKKQDFLSLLGDILYGRGVFRQRIQRENERQAMENFQTEPAQAINRMGLVNADKAWQMKQQLASRQATEEQAENARLDRQSRGSEIVSGMLGTLPEGNEEVAYTKMLPFMRQVLENYDVDPSILDDNYDKEKVGMLSRYGISGYQAAQLKRQEEAAAALQGQRVKTLALDSLGKEIAIEKLNQDERQHRERESRLNRAQVLQAREQAQKQGITLDPSFGRFQGLQPGQYVLNPSGNKVSVKRPDGLIYGYDVLKREDGSKYINPDKPIFRGTTVEGYLSR